MPEPKVVILGHPSDRRLLLAVARLDSRKHPAKVEAIQVELDRRERERQRVVRRAA